MCAEEGGNCSCPKGSIVFFGRKESAKNPGAHARYKEVKLDKWTGVQLSEGNSLKCDSSSFDGVDPLPGVHKSCYCDDNKFTNLAQLKTMTSWWKAQIEKKSAIRMRSTASKLVTSTTREVQSTIMRTEHTTKTTSTSSSTECGEKCVIKTAKYESELKRKVVYEWYSE